MFLVWFISVPVVLFLAWAAVTDVKHRRRARRDAPTGHSIDRAARKARLEGEAKGSEWGAGGV